jgi:hypothetical protein
VLTLSRVYQALICLEALGGSINLGLLASVSFNSALIALIVAGIPFSYA